MANFLGLTLLTGIVVLPHLSMYWAVGMLWNAVSFKQCRVRRRYMKLNHYFHAFNNFGIPKGNTDRIVKVQTVMEYINTKSRDVYVPEREVTVDEGGCLERGPSPSMCITLVRLQKLHENYHSC